MPRGSAVVTYRGKRGNVYRIKYRDADGVQVMETLGSEREGWNAKKARNELREREVRVEQKGYVKPSQLTFAAYADTWFAESATRRRWKASTVLQYRSVKARLVEEFGPMPLTTIRPRHVAAYVAEKSKTLQAVTVNRDLAVLHSMFKTAFREELVDRNAADAVERPKMPPFRPQILEREEVVLVARQACWSDPQARTAFLTLMLTGLRRSELQALRWRDVEFTEPGGPILRVRDSKSESGIRSIALGADLTEALWQHRRASTFQGNDERVFTSSTGHVYRADTFKEALEAALSAAGVTKRPRPFHDLRHSCLTHDAANGTSPMVLMEKAGHADLRTTRRYVHLAGQVFREEADALERRLLGVAE